MDYYNKSYDPAPTGTGTVSTFDVKFKKSGGRERPTVKRTKELQSQLTDTSGVLQKTLAEFKALDAENQELRRQVQGQFTREQVVNLLSITFNGDERLRAALDSCKSYEQIEAALVAFSAVFKMIGGWIGEARASEVALASAPTIPPVAAEPRTIGIRIAATSPKSNHIAVIRQLRESFNLSLREAKEIADKARDNCSTVMPVPAQPEATSAEVRARNIVQTLGFAGCWASVVSS